MEKVLALDIIPVGSDDPRSIDYDLEKSASCSAISYKTAADWDTSSLEIKWNSTDRFFSVEFKGTADDRIKLPLSHALSKKIPLQIARSSTCECGAPLQLGDYTVTVEDSDFRFRADYFCPICKAKLVADKKGFKKIIEPWVMGLRKIEIKATGVGGVGIERT